MHENWGILFAASQSHAPSINMKLNGRTESCNESKEPHCAFAVFEGVDCDGLEYDDAGSTRRSLY